MRTAKKQTTPRLCIACSNFGCFLLTTDFVSHLQRNSKRLSRVRYFWAVRCSILASLRVPDWLVHDEVGHSNDLQNRKVIRVRHHRITAVQDRPRRSCLHLPACLPVSVGRASVGAPCARASVLACSCSFNAIQQGWCTTRCTKGTCQSGRDRPLHNMKCTAMQEQLFSS